MLPSNPAETLMRFLSFRPERSDQVLSLFSELEGAIPHVDGGKNNFVYIPGKRPDRVVLVAHADTVWDLFYLKELYPYTDPELAEKLPHMIHDPVFDGKTVFQNGWSGWGLGADDRAGCAMLWLLKDSGHSLLVTDGEEHGQIGSHYLTDHYPALSEELNAHSYMIQLDRRGSSDYKTYNLPVTGAFCRFIRWHTGCRDAGKTSRTDIVALCRTVCGVNLSIGYRNEHSPAEQLSYASWLKMLTKLSRMLEKKQPRFPLLEE